MTTPRSENEGDATRRPLLPHHAALIADSAISAAVAADRGYWTATKAVELERLGYGRTQASVPALVIPLRGVDGDVVGYQTRPDTPRVVDGKPLKYESPAGSVPVLDVPAGARELLRSNRTLWVTEGARKADAAVTAGLTCVSLPGVWSWVRKLKDSKTVLPDLLRIPLEDRKVVIGFDSDVMVKPAVHAALTKLAEWLGSRGAWVHCLYLPHDDDAKLGLDDALHAGYTTDELWRHIEPGVRPLKAEPKEVVLPTMYLLRDIEKLLRKFVRFTDERGDAEITALALYVLHTWALDSAHATPYVYIKSPAKRAGKTRLLEVLELVCRNPVRAASVTAAAVFQLIEMKQPTLMIDEVDAIFSVRSEYTEALRGILNDGFRPGGRVIRGTQEGEPREFSTFSPKVIAGIENSRLPDTIVDRSIVIALERKLKSEPVARLRERDVAGQAQEMRDRLADWALLANDRLSEYRVDTIKEISDRAEDIWEPLLAIAQDAGGDWHDRARAAAVRLSGEAAGDEDDTLLLLRRLREMFEATGVLTSKEIVTSVNDDADLPFSDYRKGAGLNAHALAKMLAPYGVGPLRIWIGQDRKRGYKREQFRSVWERYLPDEETSRTAGAQQTVPSGPSVPNPTGTGDNGWSDLRTGTDTTVPSEQSGTDLSVHPNATVQAKSPASTGFGTDGTDGTVVRSRVGRISQRVGAGIVTSTQKTLATRGPFPRFHRFPTPNGKHGNAQTNGSRMSTAFAVADQLRRARSELRRHDLDVRLGRAERDHAWRDEHVALINDMQTSLDRLLRFRKDANA